MKKFPMNKYNKRMLKVRKIIKNTPSKLHHIHQRRGILRPCETSKMEISAKTAKDFQSLTSISEV